jgi:zinc protease
MPEAFEYSRSFFKRFYRPENVVLLIVGDIHPDRVMKLITKYYSSWQRGYEAPNIQPEPPQTGERTAEVSYTGKTLPIIDIAYKGEAFNPKNTTYAAALMFGELAFGSTSELYKKLYIKEQRVDVLDASIAMNRDMPLFEIAARVKKDDDVTAVRDEIYGTIETFQRTPVDAQRLADAKKRRRYGFLMNLDTPNKVAGTLARYVAMTGGVEAVDEMFATLDRVTPEDIMNAAKLYFDPARRTVVTLKGAR